MAISAKDVMDLRKRTGLGMMECKAALTETDGDAQAAIALLRERAKGKMDERTDREAQEGVLAVASKPGEVAMIRLVSETDFVARNEAFVKAAQQIADLALAGPAGQVQPSEAITAIVDELRISTKENISFKGGIKLAAPVVGSYLHHNHQVGAIVAGEGDLSDDLLTGICQHITAAVPTPVAIDEDGLDPAARDEQKAAFIAEAEASGKPREIAEKMVVGRMRKWADEQTLMGQLYLREMDAKKPVRDYIPKGAKITAMHRLSMAD